MSGPATFKRLRVFDSSNRPRGITTTFRQLLLPNKDLRQTRRRFEQGHLCPMYLKRKFWKYVKRGHNKALRTHEQVNEMTLQLCMLIDAKTRTPERSPHLRLCILTNDESPSSALPYRSRNPKHKPGISKRDASWKVRPSEKSQIQALVQQRLTS